MLLSENLLKKLKISRAINHHFSRRQREPAAIIGMPLCLFIASVQIEI